MNGIHGRYGWIMRVCTSALTMNILLNDSTIKVIDIFLVDAQVPGEYAFDGLVDVAVDLCAVALLLEAEEVEHVVPLALLLDHVDVVVDQLQELLLQHLPVLPLVVYYRPDVLLLQLTHLVLLETVVQLLDPTKLDVAALPELADLAPAVEVELDAEGLLALGGLDVGDEVDGERSALVDGGEGADDEAAVDVYGGAVGDAAVVEVEHLLPDAVAVVGLALIEGLLLEDAALHLVEELLLGEGTREVAVVLVVEEAVLVGGVALAGQAVDALLEERVVEVVVLHLLQEEDERLLEARPRLADVDQRLADQHDLVLPDRLPREVRQLLLGPHLLDLLRAVLPLRDLLPHDGVPVEHPALVGQVVRVLEVEALEVGTADQPVDLGQQRHHLGVPLQLQQAVNLPVVALVVGGVRHHRQVRVQRARVEQPQLEQAGRRVRVQDGPVLGAGPQDAGQRLLVLQDRLHVLLGLEEGVALVAQLVGRGGLPVRGLAADDGDVVGEEEQLRQELVVDLPAEGVGDADLDPREQALLEDGGLAVVSVDGHQHGQGVLLEGAAGSGEHVGAVLQPDRPQDAEAQVDQCVDAVLKLGQTGDLALARLHCPRRQLPRVEVQLLPLQRQRLELVHRLQVVITERTHRLLLHWPTT